MVYDLLFKCYILALGEAETEGEKLGSNIIATCQAPNKQTLTQPPNSIPNSSTAWDWPSSKFGIGDWVAAHLRERAPKIPKKTLLYMPKVWEVQEVGQGKPINAAT